MQLGGYFLGKIAQVSTCMLCVRMCQIDVGGDFSLSIEQNLPNHQIKSQ